MKRKTFLGLAIMVVTLATILAGTFTTQAAYPPGAFVEKGGVGYLYYPPFTWTSTDMEWVITPSGNNKYICHFDTPGLNLEKTEIYKGWPCGIYPYPGATELVFSTISHCVFNKGGKATVTVQIRPEDLP